jgi:hypothetical protein
MPRRSCSTGSELFIVDNSDEDWKVLRYLHDWCQISKSIDIATAYFEIGSLLALQDEWQKVDQIRILMGDGLLPKFPPFISRVDRFLTCPAKAYQVEVEDSAAWSGYGRKFRRFLRSTDSSEWLQ